MCVLIFFFDGPQSAGFRHRWLRHWRRRFRLIFFLKKRHRHHNQNIDGADYSMTTPIGNTWPRPFRADQKKKPRKIQIKSTRPIKKPPAGKSKKKNNNQQETQRTKEGSSWKFPHKKKLTQKKSFHRKNLSWKTKDVVDKKWRNPEGKKKEINSSRAASSRPWFPIKCKKKFNKTSNRKIKLFFFLQKARPSQTRRTIKRETKT